jgi:hypothetical protein
MEATGAQPEPERRIGRPLAIAGVAVLALAAGAAAIFLISRGGSSESTNGPVGKPIKPVELNESGLRILAGAIPQPIYWAGPLPGYLYELKRTTGGDVYVRYLPKRVKAGAGGSSYLVVATYPYPNAQSALRQTHPGRLINLPHGGVALVSPTYRKSIHLAYPRSDFQVEVYDPSAATVLHLVSSGQIRPVAG